MTNWQPGMVITAARLNDGIDATTTGTGLVAAPNFTVSSFVGSRSGKNVSLDFVLQRTTSDLVPTSSAGNFSPDVVAATVPAGWCPTTGTINGTWDNGTAEGGFVIGTDGKCTIRTGNGSTVSVGTNLTFHVSFILT